MADNGSGSLVFGASLRGEIAHVAGSGTTLPGEFGSDAHSDAAESDSESGSVGPGDCGKRKRTSGSARRETSNSAR